MKTLIFSLLLFTNVGAVAVLPEEVEVPKRKVNRLNTKGEKSYKYHR